MPKGLGRRGDTNKAPHKREERRGYTWGGGWLFVYGEKHWEQHSRSDQVRSGQDWVWLALHTHLEGGMLQAC